MEQIKNKGGRPRIGKEKKITKGFTLDPQVYEDMRIYCKINDFSMSNLVEEFFRQSINMERSRFLIKNEDL